MKAFDKIKKIGQDHKDAVKIVVAGAAIGMTMYTTYAFGYIVGMCNAAGKIGQACRDNLDSETYDKVFEAVKKVSY